MKYVIPFLCVICAALAGCTGFEDGPALSFKATEKQIANDWTVDEALLLNTDITDRYTSDVITFEEAKGFNYLDASRIVSFPPFTSTDTVAALGNGRWDFLDKNNMIELLYTFTFRDQYDTTIIYAEERYEQWEIQRLTSEELWLRNDSVSLKLSPN